MIRTNIVELTVIPAAAYRQKLPSGGSGIVILRYDAPQPGIASISKTSGDAIPSANTSQKLYPQEAFKEAMELTSGMPYKKQGSVRLKEKRVEEAPKPEVIESPETEAEEIAVDSAEYRKIVTRYTDKNGRLSYDLLNRDLIKFAHYSSKVRGMIAEKRPVEDIRLYTVGTKFRTIAENDKLTDAQILKIAELLDEVSPKGVFKEFNDELRLKLRTAKGK